MRVGLQVLRYYRCHPPRHLGRTVWWHLALCRARRSMLGDVHSLGLQQQPRWPPCSRCRRQAPSLAQLQPFRRVFSRKEPAHSLPDLMRSQGSSRTGSGVDPRDGRSATGEAAVSEQPAPPANTTGSFDKPCGAREALQQSSTRFVAETKLPTRTGTYRVRAYRHTVRPHSSLRVQGPPRA